jgi:hypothetical protein
MKAHTNNKYKVAALFTALTLALSASAPSFAAGSADGELSNSGGGGVR